MDRLSKLFEDLHWRIDLLSTNRLDFSYNAIGIIDGPINVIFDSNSRQLSDVFRPRINQSNVFDLELYCHRVQRVNSLIDGLLPLITLEVTLKRPKG